MSGEQREALSSPQAQGGKLCCNGLACDMKKPPQNHNSFFFIIETEYCVAGNFRQRKISSKPTVGQFVRNLFSSSCRSFALRLFGRRSLLFVFLHIQEFVAHTFGFVKKFSQEFDLVKKLV